MAKYAACIAAGTVLYHLHACFKLSDAMMGSDEGAAGLGDATWWQGKALLGAMSLLLQKVPMIAVNKLFRIERNRRRAEAMQLRPHTFCGLCKVPRAFAIVPWFAFFLLLVACFGIIIVLTSTGFLQTGAANGGPGEDTTHCGCAGVTAGKDVESDWITLLLLIVGFRTLVYRPLMILVGTALFVCNERRKGKVRARSRSIPLSDCTESSDRIGLEMALPKRSFRIKRKFTSNGDGAETKSSDSFLTEGEDNKFGRERTTSEVENPYVQSVWVKCVCYVRCACHLLRQNIPITDNLFPPFPFRLFCVPFAPLLTHDPGSQCF